MKPQHLFKEVLCKTSRYLQFKWEIWKIHELYIKYQSYTMIPKKIFLQNLKLYSQFKHLPGDIVECGVWKGGMAAASAELLGESGRNYYLFDSFEGLPDAKEIDGVSAIDYQKNTDSPYYFDNCSADIRYAEEAMKHTGLVHYHVIKGWFSDTLPAFTPKQPIAILRLDGDWYESTKVCLNELYRHVIKNGIIIIDDYYTWDGCAKAIHDFLSEHHLPDRIHEKNGICYLVKS